MKFIEGNQLLLLSVFVATLAIIFAVVVVGLALLLRKRGQRRLESTRAQLQSFYAYKINALLLGTNDDDEDLEMSGDDQRRALVEELNEGLRKTGRFARKLHRETIRDVMIDLARNLVGESRSAIGEMFGLLGFADEELTDLDSKHWWVRAKACRASSIMSSKGAVERLVALLEDEEEDVRVEAAMALVEIAGTDALGPLLKHLKKISVWMSLQLSHAILKMGSAAVEDLVAGLNSDSYSVQSFCVQMLSAIGDVRAVEPLIRLAQYASAPLRSQAITALGVFGEGTSLTIIMKNCSHDNEEVRKCAASALGRFDTPLGVPFLRELLLHDAVDVRLAAGESLARLGKAGNAALREAEISADNLGRGIALQFRSEFETISTE